MAVMTELCGWLIRGEETRPCIVKLGHKSQHRDEGQRKQNREYYQTNAEQIAERRRGYGQVNREQIAEKKRTYKFGVPAGWYEQQLERQEFKCAICPRTEPGGHGRFHVDHDHACCPGRKSCGKCVRGLLCHGCNVGLGCLQDSSDILCAAISYLALYEI